ncbi:hypothetical protein AVEN_269918-1 [Araneus ventricosus]|uniref:Uncharacterized protein n=1 Tax=Araneus ventricosus TaxID=182803 RepID=A0A4Y2FNP7_ARAVE|nr:hypothetical protein AVEN_269918-1 [Araneus ventricosus]
MRCFNVGLRSSHWGLRKEIDSHAKTPQELVWEILYISIYLEVIQDIEAGQELHLASYNLLLAHESSSHQRNGSLAPHEAAG